MMTGTEVRSLFINIMKLNIERVKGTALYDEIQKDVATEKKYNGSNKMLASLKLQIHKKVID